MPVIGYYASSKWAFEAIYESLAAEVAPFGIKVTLIEPGAYATDSNSPASMRFAMGLAAYTDFKNRFFAGSVGWERGDPARHPGGALYRGRRHAAATPCPLRRAASHLGSLGNRGQCGAGPSQVNHHGQPVVELTTGCYWS